MTEAYKEIDPNMIIETKLDAPDIRFHDIRKPPFNVYGLYDYQNQPFFRRMPEDVAAKVSPGVARLESQAPDVDGVTHLAPPPGRKKAPAVGALVRVRIDAVKGYDFEGTPVS